jgi:hypothetical protein
MICELELCCLQLGGKGEQPPTRTKYLRKLQVMQQGHLGTVGGRNIASILQAGMLKQS